MLTIYNNYNGVDSYVARVTDSGSIEVVAQSFEAVPFLDNDMDQFTVIEVPIGSSYILRSSPMYEDDPLAGECEWFEIDQ